MAGDIFLMLPRERFIAGLVAFLLAHVAYVVGFNQTPTAFNLAGFILAVSVTLVFLRVYRRIAAGLDCIRAACSKNSGADLQPGD